ncbi:hypothetical protein NQ314_001954 [Rhamnusium bicolor]|uniref:Uncharacterized protein n=1 Tax=Rhamnusium bicolor TaxID=1586634 RepID=A0AAV8ZR32_9CUCU|nr:hypothetical protein NQ314_001954 [Rhamnusium bicolor]
MFRQKRGNPTGGGGYRGSGGYCSDVGGGFRENRRGRPGGGRFNSYGGGGRCTDSGGGAGRFGGRDLNRSSDSYSYYCRGGGGGEYRN